MCCNIKYYVDNLQLNTDEQQHLRVLLHLQNVTERSSRFVWCLSVSLPCSVIGGVSLLHVCAQGPNVYNKSVYFKISAIKINK